MMYKLAELGGGGRGNSGNARKKTFFSAGDVPLGSHFLIFGVAIAIAI